MRIRSIKPAYWTDPDLHTGLTAAGREFYIGLWMLADDSGWLEWEPRRIGAELYPFHAMSRRLREVETHSRAVASLTPSSPHLVIHDCGHAQVPKMPQHQYPGGKPVYTVKRKHEVRCLTVMPQGSPDIPGVPQDAHNGKVGKGRVGIGEGGVRGGPYEVIDGRLTKVAG